MYLKCKKTLLCLISIFFCFNFFILPSKAHAVKCSLITCHKDGNLSCSVCKTRYCGSTCQTDDWALHKKVCKKRLQPWSALAGGVEIRDSTIPGAGRGLFAARDFRRHEKIAVYEGKRIDGIIKDSPLFSAQFGVNPYTQLIGSGIILGDSNPPTAHLGAQIANDPNIDPEFYSSIFSVRCEAPDLASIQNGVRGYLVNFFAKKHNAIISGAENGFPILIADREIKTGEEIFNPYGVNYWIGILMGICERKGYAFEAKQVQRAASEVAEGFRRTHLLEHLPLVAFFDSYIPAPHYELLQKALLPYARASVSQKFAILFAAPHQFWIYIVNSAAFEAMTAELHFVEKLQEITQTPNESVIRSDGTIIVHPRSRALLRDVLEYGKTHGGLPIQFIALQSSERALTLDEIEVLAAPLPLIP